MSDVIRGFATFHLLQRFLINVDFNTAVSISNRSIQDKPRSHELKLQDLLRMPRGAEFVDGPPASDNAVEAGENKIAGAPQDGQDNSTASVDRSGKAAPLPSGMEEMKDSIKSGAGSQSLPGGGKDLNAKGDAEPNV